MIEKTKEFEDRPIDIVHSKEQAFEIKRKRNEAQKIGEQRDNIIKASDIDIWSSRKVVERAGRPGR